LQGGERLEVAGPFVSGHDHVQCLIDVRELLETSNQGDEFTRLQEDESTVAVVVGQRAEGLVTKRDLRAERPRTCRVEDRRERTLHDLVDAAEAVDGDLLHQQLLAGQLLNDDFFFDDFFYDGGIWCHATSSLPILLADARAEVPWETQIVTLPAAPTANALESPLEPGTRVDLDPRARFHDTNLVTGGSPWRLLHLPGASRATLERWRTGAAVRAGEGGLARTLVQQGLLRTYRETPFDAEELDVVIPFHGDAVALSELLEKLAGLHVTVVDDASSDPEAIRNAVAVAGPSATLERHEVLSGPAAARNTGLRATNRPFVCFLDADVHLDDAAQVLARLRAALHDPLVGAVAPRVRGSQGASTRERFEARFSPLDRGPDSGLVRPNSAVNFVPSALLVVRRSAVGDGFDESLRFGEDVDLVWRLNDQGWLVRYEASVVVTHPARPTWLAWWRQRVRYGASSAPLAQRHGARLAPVRVDPVTAAALLGLLFARPALSARVLKVAQRHFAERLPASTERPERVAHEVVAMGVVRAAGPLARALVRSYGPLLLLGLVHPKLRRRLVVVLALGVAWRWRRERFRAADLPLALADDLAYGVGVLSAAVRERTWRGVVPHVTKTSIRLSDLVRLT